MRNAELEGLAAGTRFISLVCFDVSAMRRNDSLWPSLPGMTSRSRTASQGRPLVGRPQTADPDIQRTSDARPYACYALRAGSDPLIAPPSLCHGFTQAKLESKDLAPRRNALFFKRRFDDGITPFAGDPVYLPQWGRMSAQLTSEGARCQLLFLPLAVTRSFPSSPASRELSPLWEAQ